MYSCPKNECVNDVLKPEPKLGKNPLDYIKSVGPTALPSCPKVLLQQIKQEYFTAHLYSTAYDVYLAFDLFPIDYSYKLSVNKESLEMHQFDRDQTPHSIEKLQADRDKGNKSDEDDADVEDSDSDDEENNDKFDGAQI